jgi:hypothetical protein
MRYAAGAFNGEEANISKERKKVEAVASCRVRS